jgi:hypothetical protein
MDYEPLLELRLNLRKLRGMPLEATEFVSHADRTLLVDWRVHPLDPARVRVKDSLVVDPRFNRVVERMEAIAGRYYDEMQLREPSPGFHWQNVEQALLLMTGCLRAASQWFAACKASEKVVEDIFLVVRDAMGMLATAPDAVKAVRAEAVVEETIKEMDRRRRLARCADIRIVA